MQQKERSASWANIKQHRSQSYPEKSTKEAQKASLHPHAGSENRPEYNADTRTVTVCPHFFFLDSLNFHTFVLTTTTTLHLHLQVHSELSLQVVNMI